MTHVGQFERERAVGAYVGAEIPQCVDDGVDDQTVLAGIFRRTHEGGGVDARPREWAGHDACARLAYEELGARADETVAGVDDAAGLYAPQMREHGRDVEGMVGID